MIEKVFDHIREIIAGTVVIVGVTAICFGRDSYLVGVVGTALGFLFGAGTSYIHRRRE